MSESGNEKHKRNRKSRRKFEFEKENETSIIIEYFKINRENVGFEPTKTAKLVPLASQVIVSTFDQRLGNSKHRILAKLIFYL